MSVFRAVLTDVSLLRDAVDTISQLIGEGIFKADKDGISFNATDRAIVAVVDFKLDKNVFEVYEVSGTIKMGLNVDSLLQILKRAGAKDKLELSLSDDESKLNVKMVGETTRKFSMPLLDITEGEVPSPDNLDFSTKLQIRTPVIEEGVSDAAIVSDSLVFESEDDALVMRTDGDSSSAELRVDKNGGLLSLNGKPARSRYPLDYLKKMIRGARIADVASISFGKDFPMRIEFINPEKASMRFLLAPRVED
ncbi:MAG: DNA polymerase sliding clamp [Candidatus Aenigmatarchaeota archaeon]|nr:MAG: DNA polymerase sliding clamp [Candidatus Aenigmarchaeota archaeon]